MAFFSRFVVLPLLATATIVLAHQELGACTGGDEESDCGDGDEESDATGLLVLRSASTSTTTTPTPTNITAVDLGSAADFAILTSTGVTTTGITSVGGDMGVSPIASTSMTGFTLSPPHPNTIFSTSPLVSGQIFAADYGTPTPVKMTTAIADMGTAYTAAAGANGVPRTSELGAGNIEGLTIPGGLHKWSTSVGFFSALTFDAAGDNGTVWIMQIAGDLRLATGAKVTLTNAARASNIFWQVGGQTQILAGAHAEGIILSKTAIIFGSGSSLNGRALAQTEVTMIATTITTANIDEPQK